MTPDEYREHAARAMHEDVTPVEPKIEETPYSLTLGSLRVFLFRDKTIWLGDKSADIFLTTGQIDDAIALLQRARDIMKGGSA